MGFERIDLFFVLQEVIGPILTQLLDHLLVPLCLSKVIGAALFPADYFRRSIILRFSFLIYFGLIMALRVLKLALFTVIRIHNEFRDSRYLLGTELANNP